MKKKIILGFWIALLTVIEPLAAQQRYFYCLKYVQKDKKKIKPPCETGIYVTFPIAKDGKYICYDSDREGYAVNASYKLDYMGKNRNGYSYYGWTYWGKAHYYFSTDYSFLNVVDEVGNIYVYHRTNGTQSSSTYYSVTDSRNNSRESGKTITFPNSSTSTVISLSERSTKRIVRIKCNFCNGTGISWSEKKYSPNYTGSDERQWCSRCNAWGIPHYHIDHRCTVCKNGYIEKEE